MLAYSLLSLRHTYIHESIIIIIDTSVHCAIACIYRAHNAVHVHIRIRGIIYSIRWLPAHAHYYTNAGALGRAAGHSNDWQLYLYKMEEVSRLLRREGFEESVIECFKRNKIDMDVFLDMSKDDMIELGISALGDRKKLTKLIQSGKINLSLTEKSNKPVKDIEPDERDEEIDSDLYSSTTSEEEILTFAKDGKPTTSTPLQKSNSSVSSNF